MPEELQTASESVVGLNALLVVPALFPQWEQEQESFGTTKKQSSTSRIIGTLIGS